MTEPLTSEKFKKCFDTLKDPKDSLWELGALHFEEHPQPPLFLGKAVPLSKNQKPSLKRTSSSEEKKDSEQAQKSWIVFQNQKNMGPFTLPEVALFI